MNSEKNSPKKIATPKQTAGGGYAFEDKVVAYYLTWMLSGHPPFSRAHGSINRIDCQVQVDGWLFDDLLLSLKSKDQHHRYALSIKSNVQFSRTSAPSDFVETAWSLFMHEANDVFMPEADMMGLICSLHPDPPKSAIQNLLRKAHDQTPEQLASRIRISGYASEVERSIFESFACPEKIAEKHDSEKWCTGEILKRIVIKELDFETSESDDKERMIFICCALLLNGSVEDGLDLWNELFQKAQKLRISGGGITREQLLVELRHRFEFRDFPDFSSDWHCLDNWFLIELKAIPDHIGGIVQIERQDLVDEVLNNLHNKPFTSLIGPSGAGKTVIGKWAAREFSKHANILWFKGERFRSGYIENFANHHGLTHPLSEVIENTRHAHGLVVIDSAERLLDEDDFKEAAKLLHLFRMNESSCIWHLLVTCRAEKWDRVQLELMRNFGNFIEWELVHLPSPNLKQLQPVWHAFPSLYDLAVQPHLEKLMCNPKILDILTWAIQTGYEISGRQWLGESDVIKWYWEIVVHSGEHGTSRSALLQRIAEIEADSGRFELAESELTSNDLNLISGLRDILTLDERSTIAFSHDRLADWSRLQAILSHESMLGEYLQDRLKNPHWQTALRLYGIELLESDNTGENWKKVLDEHSEIQNSLIESLIFAGNSQELLETTWPILLAEDGHLLLALLKRFLFIATIPNPQYLMLAQVVDATNVEARIWERKPLWMYWPDFLRFIASKAEELIRLAPNEIARIAYTWLRYTPHDWPCRDDAANLALAAGWYAFRTQRSYYYHRSNTDRQLPYKAVLEAFWDKPNDVRELALKASARKPPTEEDGEAFEVYYLTGNVTNDHPLAIDDETNIQDIWPLGPLYRVDAAFKKACFSSDSLRAMMEHQPELAGEIILALLIEVKNPNYFGGDSFDTIFPYKKMGLVDDNSFYPRFYAQGPFLLFLRTNTKYALNTIIHLVDFATARWIEDNYEGESLDVGVDITYKSRTKRFIGDTQIYNWYHAIVGSDVITSALMAIEKWLYDRIDSGESVEEWLYYIFDKSASLAFIGLLSEIGRYDTKLFATILKPLLLVSDFYYMEHLYIVQGGRLFATPFSNQGEWLWKLYREWDGMVHRSLRLTIIAANLFYSNDESRAEMLIAREKWKENLDSKSAEQRNFTQKLISAFDPGNWKEVVLPDGSVEFVYNEPKSLQAEPEEVEAQRWSHFTINRRIECQRKLIENTTVADDQITDFLTPAKELSNLKNGDLKAEEYVSIADAICGTIAVLFKLHRAWLRDNLQEEKWCTEKLTEIIDSFPPGSVWLAFVCEVLPILWSEGPDNSQWSKYISKLVVTGRYDATSLLIRNSFEKREELGDEFWRLVNFVLDWAGVLYVIRRAQSNRKKININKLQRKTAQKFNRCNYTGDMLPWGEKSIKIGKLWSYWDHPRYINDRRVSLFYYAPRIDVELIRHTFKDIFHPEQAIEQDERSKFLNFWEQALVTCLTRTKYYDENGIALENEKLEAGLPYDYDNWVFENLTIVITQMHQNENAERFWLPILSLGPRAKHWVERFLSNWFLDAKQLADQGRFVYHWQQMIEFCLSSDQWINPDVPFAYHQSSLWLMLIGISSFSGSLWTDDDQNIIDKMDTYLIEIVPRILRNRDDSRRLVSWLCESSSKTIRIRILNPLSSEAEKANISWWEEQRLITAIARYLNVLWDEHRPELRANTVLRNNFETLLHAISERHEPLALALQKRISSR